MSWKAIVRVCGVFEDKIGPPLALIVSGGLFFGSLFLKHASLHLTPRDGHFDYGGPVPVFLLAFWALSKYAEENTLAWKLILPATMFVIGLQFIY
ncbi:hypothetical protein HZC00_03340 [Candidatus Kaiserbacteria bacterium]|nr:hypothetical protein [Candidatus Kaiserbacteria bacterium]